MARVDPLFGLPAELRRLIAVRPNGCWRWKGSHRKHDGRPVFKRKYVYRLTYSILRRKLRAGQILHHRKCQNKKCVNPWHVVAITQSAHMKEHGFGGDNGGQSQKTHCPAGHEYSDSNTYVFVRFKCGRIVTERHCRACAAEKMRLRRARLRVK